MNTVSTHAATTAGIRTIEPSIGNALPHFSPLVVFPLLACGALYGGLWIVIPFVIFMFIDRLDSVFGLEERNIDPRATHESKLFVYKLSLWAWAVLWPITFVFALWQMLVVGHLATWEIAMMAIALTGVGQSVFIVGHELAHRRAAWERKLGDLLLGCGSYPHYATEHVYIHHPRVCTPGDPGSAPKGVSFWKYLPRELASNLVGAWRFELAWLARRHLPAWHYSNPFWRYLIVTAGWYGLVFWMGGPWAVLVYAALCFIAVFSMKVSNYVQHYGLRRIRLPNGRYEPVKARHAWSAAYRFTNWFHYNMQRHADHHAATNRRYPLLQHHGPDQSPQLPGAYIEMGSLAMSPKRWFETMDPLLDRVRAHFYPQIEDWSAYDSRAFAVRPDAFKVIAEIHAAAPRIAGWINRSPALLDNLRESEFTDLELPDGFGPDPEFEAIARRGLVRVYWTHELGEAEMRQQLAELPVRDAKDAVAATREWSNGKVFQIGLHTVRGSLAPPEAGAAFANVAAASVSAVLSAVEEDFADSGAVRPSGGLAAVVLGELAGPEAVPGAALEVLLVYAGGPAKRYERLCRRFRAALGALSRDNLLLAPIPRRGQGRPAISLDDFSERLRTSATTAELLGTAHARCVFVSGDERIREWFDAARRAAFAQGASHVAPIAERRPSGVDAAEAGLASIEEMPGGLRDVECAARSLRVALAGKVPDLLDRDTAAVFRVARNRGLLSARAAGTLAEAAVLWNNLRGILRLVADDGLDIDSPGGRVKAVITRAAGMDDFDALADTIRATAARAADEIDALTKVIPGRRSIRPVATDPSVMSGEAGRA